MSDASLVPARLSELETVIEGGMRTFVEVGTALAEIRDRKLYRSKAHPTFDEYCKARWGFNRQRAYQMIEAASVTNEMSKNLDSPLPLPIRDSHAHELAKVAPEHRAETWATVVKERGADVTARDVREVAQVLDTVRTEPDGAQLIEHVSAGDWTLSDAKQELKQRGVDWKQPANVTAFPRPGDRATPEQIDGVAQLFYDAQLPAMVASAVLEAQQHITAGSRKAQDALKRIRWEDVTDEMLADDTITDAVHYTDAELTRFFAVFQQARRADAGLRSVK